MISWRRLLKIVTTLLPWLIIAYFSYQYIQLAWLNELHLRNSLDLGIFHQAVYQISQGDLLPHSSLKQQIIWGDHANFILFPIALIYRFLPDVRTLLIIQALTITTSAWPVFKLAQAKIKNYLFSLAIIFSYLLFFGFQYALDNDFHPSALAAAAIAWALWAAHTKKQKTYWLIFALGLAIQEDIALIFVVLGIYFFLTKKRKLGLLTSLLALAYFIIITFFIMPIWTPHHAAVGHFDIAGVEGSTWHKATHIILNPIDTTKQLIDQPQKRHSLKTIFQSHGYLPLASPATYLLTSPSIVSRFLSARYTRWQIGFHYNATLAPLLAYGTILTTYWIRKAAIKVSQEKLFHLLITTLLAIALLYGTYASSWRDPDLPLHKLSHPEFTEREFQPVMSRPALEIIKAMIPPEKSVSVASGLLPTLSGRPFVYSYPEPFPKQTKYVVLSTEFNTWPLPKGEMEAVIDEFRDNPNYTLFWDDFGIVGFKKIPLS